MARADGSGCAAAGSGQLRGARRFVARRRGAILRAQARGGMAEWLKAHAWKACIRETVSWVRIPLPPPAPLARTSSVDDGTRKIRRNGGLLRGNLWTGDVDLMLGSFSVRPVFSEALDCAESVRS